MMSVEQSVMCALLGVLKDKNLISENVHKQAEEGVLGTLDWPEFFYYSDGDVKEDVDGSR